MSNKLFEQFIRACIKNGIIIDTCLFLALIFGNNHKRTKNLDNILPILSIIVTYCTSQQSQIIITPHILAELSNLTVNRSKDIDNEDKKNINALINKVKESTEAFIAKNDILNNHATHFLGFTDVSIIEAARKYEYGVLTQDAKLYLELQRANCQSINILDLVNYKQLLEVYQR